MITKPQAAFLGSIIKQPRAGYAGSAIVASNLQRAGLVETTRDPAMRCITLYRPTIAGLKALRDYRARLWAKDGCVAYLRRLEEAEAALAIAESVARAPILYGENGWSMHYREGNLTRTWNGPRLCSMLFGGLARSIESFARAFEEAR
jgi:hypothetical protein